VTCLRMTLASAVIILSASRPPAPWPDGSMTAAVGGAEGFYLASPAAMMGLV